MIVIRWGTVMSDGTSDKDWEVMFASAEDARDFHGDLLDRKTTTYISMEKIEDEHISNLVE